jgi:hypothetical protein
MSLTDITLPENPYIVVNLLKEGNLAEARAVADRCLERGVPRPQLNSLVYDYMKPLRDHDLEKAKTIAVHFAGHPYHWDGWLPQEVRAQLTLKNPEPTPNYG